MPLPVKVFEHEVWFNGVYPFQQGQGADKWEGDGRVSDQLGGKPINDMAHHKLTQIKLKLTVEITSSSEATSSTM